MKILITTDWYAPVINGVVTSVENLARGLVQEGHDVRILTLSCSVHSYTDQNVTYIGSVSAGLIYPNARLRTALASHQVRDIVAWKPDVVHSQCEFSTFFLARKIARECGAPLVHTYHTIYEDFTHYFSPSVRVGRKMATVLSRYILDKTDAVIAPTEKIALMLRGYGIEKPIFTIPTGIELSHLMTEEAEKRRDSLRASLGIAPEETVFLYLGRLAKEKNIEEVFALTEEYAPDGSCLLLVGDGPHREELMRRADAGERRCRILFAGMIAPEHVAEYYAAGDVFVTASQSEAQGLTYIEAMAAALPLLCKNDPCLDHVIEPGRSGFVYDSPQEFAEFAGKLAASEALRREIGLAARESVLNRYSIATFARKATEAYAEVIRRAAGPYTVRSYAVR